MSIENNVQAKFEKFSKYFEKADENQDGVIKGEKEISVFVTDISNDINSGELQMTKDDYAMFKDMGIDFSKGSRLTFPATSKTAENAVKGAIEKLRSDGYHGDDLIRMLESKVGNGPELQTVKQIYSLVEATGYKSKKDVEDIEKNIKAKYPNLSKFAKNVLDTMIKEAETKQIQREFEQYVKPVYYEILSQQTDKKNYEKAKKDTEKKLKNHEFLKKSYGNTAFKLLKKLTFNSKEYADFMLLKESAKSNADSDVRADYASTTATKIWGKNGIRHQMKENGYNGKDDYQEDARTRSRMLITKRHNYFVKNRDEKLGNISKKDIHETLERDFKDYANFRWGKNKSYEKLMGSKYAQEHQNADGTYNFQELANEVQKRAGSDYLVNLSSDKETKELENIKQYLSNLLGQELNNLETREIIELCGLKVEAKKGPIIDAASGFASGFRYLHVEQTVDIPFKNLDTSMIKELTEQITKAGYGNCITETENGIRVYVHQLVEDSVLSGLTGAATNILLSAMLSEVLANAPVEKSAYNIMDMDLSDPQYTDFNKFKEYIISRYPKETAEMILAIAQVGGWDPVKFDSILKSIAGLGSHMNRKEQTGGAIYGSQVKVETQSKPEVKPEEEQKVDPKKEQNVDHEEKPKVKEPCTTCEADVFEDFKKLEDAKKYNWNTIYAYYADCLKQNGGTHTEAEVRSAIYKYNGVKQSKDMNIFMRVDKDGKSIPLNLPKDLFGDGCKIRDLKPEELEVLRKQGRVPGATGKGIRSTYVDGSYRIHKYCTTTDENGNTRTKEYISEPFKSQTEADNNKNNDNIKWTEVK